MFALAQLIITFTHDISLLFHNSSFHASKNHERQLLSTFKYNYYTRILIKLRHLTQSQINTNSNNTSYKF